MNLRARTHSSDVEGEREVFGRMSFRMKLTCPECDAVCEVEALGYRATKKAAEIGHAFLTKHDHHVFAEAAKKWSLP